MIFTLISSALIYWTLSNNSLIQRTWMFRLRITTQPWTTFILLNIHYNSRWANHTPRAAALFNQDLRVAKREKRRLERMFRKSHLSVHRQLFMKACSRYNRILDSVRSDYVRAKIDQAGKHRHLNLLIDCSPWDHRFYQLSMILWILCTRDSEPEGWVRGNF